MVTIGGNRFYPTQVEAEVEGICRNGSEIRQTEKGFILLEPGEGVTDASSCAIGAPIVARKVRGVWTNPNT